MANKIHALVIEIPPLNPMLLQAARNNCLVKIEKKYTDEIGSLKIDPTWQPEEYATLEGVVVSAPALIDHDRHRDVVGVLSPGDRIIFSYGVVFDFLSQPDDDTPVFKNLISFGRGDYWKVDMGEIFCKVEGESIEMITDHVLLSPFSVSRETNTGGLFKPEENTDHLGVIKGLPSNTNLSVRVGDTVCFEPRFVQRYNILGHEHYIIPTRRVLAKC